MADIQWPWQYDFPPFFTLQPNLETRKKQLESWRALILQYFRKTNLCTLDLTDVSHSPLFNNSSISRSLNKEDIITILTFLMKSGNAEPIDKCGTRWYIYWHSVEEWASIIHNWVQKNGLTNSVVTFYEMTSASGEEFCGLDQDVLVKALKKLEEQGKAEIIAMDENSGVKFFD